MSPKAVIIFLFDCALICKKDIAGLALQQSIKKRGFRTNAVKEDFRLERIFHPGFQRVSPVILYVGT